MTRWISFTFSACLAGGLACLSPALDRAWSQEEGQPRASVIIEAPPAVAVVAEVSPFWLGVECERVGSTLRAQLKLAEGQGLIVHSVAPDSPAAQAGVEPHDVLIQYNDAVLGGIEDLTKAVSEGEENEATLKLIRAGEAKDVQVAPQKRPAVAQFNLPADAPALARLRSWLPFEPGREPFRMLFVRPGVVGPAAAAPEFPANSTLTVVREAEGPAKITFSQGDKTWETTADKLDALPEDVRPFVGRMLANEGGWIAELRAANGPLLHDRLMNLRESMISPHGSIRVEIAPPDPNVRVEKFFHFKDKSDGIENEAADAAQPGDEENAIGELRKAVEELRSEVEKLRTEGK